MSDTVIAQTNNSVDDNRPSTDPKAETPNDIKDNGEAQGGDESTPAKKIKLSNDVTEETANEVSAPVAKGRQKSAKRLNILEKTAKEAEALLQNLGHKTDDDDSNRRRTRSQTRGTAAPSAVAPSTKKATTPKTPTKETSSGGTPKRRGRPPKNAVNNNDSVEAKTDSKTNSEEKTESVEEEPEKASNMTEKAEDAEEVRPKVSVGGDEKKTVDEVKNGSISLSAAPETATTEQTNDVSAKTNSIADNTSNSVPVIDTQQPTTE